MNSILTKAIPLFIRTRLEGRVNLQKSLTNIAWLFADQILRLGTGLIVGIWVARYLGPAQFGMLSYAVAFVGLFGVIASLGFNTIVVRDLVREPSTAGETLGTSFLVKLIAGVLTPPAAVGVIMLIGAEQEIIYWLVGIVAVGTIFQSFDTIDFWFQAQVQSKYTVYARNTAYLLASLIRIVLIQVQAPVIAFALAGLLEAALAAVGLVAMYYSSRQSLSLWQVRGSRAKKLLTESWPLILSGLAIMVYMRIDQIMLNEMIGDRAVGIYSAATRISEIWYFVPISIVSSLFPSIIEAKKLGEQVYYERLQKLFDLMSALSCAVALPMMFLSTPLIVWLFGQEFIEAGPVLAIHIWSALFVFLGVAQNPWNVNEGLTKLAMQRTILGAIVNVLLNVILIPSYGASGAAIATVISYALSACIANAFNTSTRRIFMLQARSLLFIRYLIPRA